MNKILKVAMVNTARTHGGAARMAATLTESINESNHNIQAVLYHAEDSTITDNFHGLERPGARPLNALLARVGGSLCVADLGVADEIIRLSRNADVLHLHNLHGYYLNYPKLLATWQERPVIWTWHDMWGATGRCGFSGSCDRWQTGCFNCSDKAIYPAAWLDHASHEFRQRKNLFLKLSNLWIASPSDWLRDIAVASGFNPARIKTIPNPVDANKFRLIPKHAARQSLGLPENKFTALFVASDCGDSRKGYRDFAAAVADNENHAIAVGKQPQPASESIHHIGAIQDQKLINLYYAAADVMVIPSYSDNYPNTVIESMMSGTPVIGYAEGGIPSQLNVPFSKLVDKGDIKGLRNAIIEQRHSGGKTIAMSKTISTIAYQRWAPATAMSAYTDLYLEAMKNAAIPGRSSPDTNHLQ